MKICFFAKTSLKNIHLIEFYRQDIDFLNKLGHTVKIATKITEIDWSCDLIFIWWWTYAFFPVFLARRLGIHTVITGTFNFRCPGFDLEFFQRKWLQRKLIKYAVKNTDANILVSKNEMNAMQAEWGLNNLYYSPHTVDTQKYYPNHPIEEREMFLFTLCGMTERILKRKCIPQMLQAIRLVKQEIPEIKLIIAGRNAPGELWLEKRIQELDLENNVDYIGEISEEKKIQLMQTCAVYLQPSVYEGFGLAIAEAMSCGAPVISTAVGAVPEVVGEAGILLEECTPALIKASISEVLNDFNKKTQMGNKARERILENFYPERRKNELSYVINNILN